LKLHLKKTNNRVKGVQKKLVNNSQDSKQMYNSSINTDRERDQDVRTDSVNTDFVNKILVQRSNRTDNDVMILQIEEENEEDEQSLPSQIGINKKLLQEHIKN